MSIKNRSQMAFAIILIALGVLLLAIELLPGLALDTNWPLIFFVVALAFCLPPLIMIPARQTLAGLFIPASVLLMLGLIFLYNTITGDWHSWVFAWTLIPGGVGLGMFIAAFAGNWGRAVGTAGLWVMSINVGAFALLSLFCGEPFLKSISPGILIALGLLLLIRSFTRASKSSP